MYHIQTRLVAFAYELSVNHRTHTIIELLKQRPSPKPLFTDSNRFVDQAGRPVCGQAPVAILGPRSFEKPVDDVFRICRSWSPEFIALCPPMMVCLIAGPTKINLSLARLRTLDQATGKVVSRYSMQEELIVLILTHFARYWNVGHLILGKLPHFISVRPDWLIFLDSARVYPDVSG